jgi:HEPN domain-containing protein
MWLPRRTLKVKHFLPRGYCFPKYIGGGLYFSLSANAGKAHYEKNLQDLSRLKLREAEALYQARFFDGCVYLAGYAVELALKARICKVLHVNEYPLSRDIGRAFKIHSLDQLRVLAGLSAEIDIKKNKELFDNWSKAVAWDPEQRYDPPGRYNAGTAKAVLDCLTAKKWSFFVAIETLVTNPSAFERQVVEFLRSMTQRKGEFTLAMLVPSEAGLSYKWNLVLSAPWIDRGGLEATIPTITTGLLKHLSNASAHKLERVSVLPTTDELVLTMGASRIPLGQLSRVQYFPLAEGAIVLVAMPSKATNGHRPEPLYTRA